MSINVRLIGELVSLQQIVDATQKNYPKLELKDAIVGHTEIGIQIEPRPDNIGDALELAGLTPMAGHPGVRHRAK